MVDGSALWAHSDKAVVAVRRLVGSNLLMVCAGLSVRPAHSPPPFKLKLR